MTYQTILKRAMERQAQAQLRTRAMLEPALTFADSDIVAGPARIAELVPELVARITDFMAREMTAAAARAAEDIVEPVVEATGGRARLPKSWESRAEAIVSFYSEEGREQLAAAADEYLRKLAAQQREAEAMGWSPETLLEVLRADVGIGGSGQNWGAFKAAARKVVQETTGHAWTAVWTAAWRALEVAPELIADVPPTPFEVVEGGADG